jgi:hypothetical protein
MANCPSDKPQHGQVFNREDGFWGASLMVPLAGTLTSSNIVGSMQLTERTQRAVLRYLLFLHALPYDSLVGLLPSITDMRLHYEVAPECALALLRPLLRHAIKTWAPGSAPLIRQEVALEEQEDAKMDGGSTAGALSALIAG